MTDADISTPFSVVKPPVSRGGEASSQSDALPASGEGYGDAPTGEPLNPFARVPKSRLRPAVDSAGHGKKTPRSQGSALQGPESRATFRARWKEAKSAAEVMLRAAQQQDQMAMTIAADDLEIALGRLWELRVTRDIDWKTILNHVQGMLKQMFAAKRVESLSEDQCGSILAIITDHLGPSTKTVDDLNEVLRLIEDIGFDPYGAISGEHAADPEE